MKTLNVVLIVLDHTAASVKLVTLGTEENANCGKKLRG